MRKENAIKVAKERQKRNDYCIENNIAYIEIAENKYTIIDFEDLDKVIKYAWYINNKGYVYTRQNGKTMFLPRVIMNVIDNTEKQVTVDHINHNTLDNRRCNLRIANQSEQNMNQGIQENNTSGVTGVSWKEKNTQMASTNRV